MIFYLICFSFIFGFNLNNRSSQSEYKDMNLRELLILEIVTKFLD